MTYARVLGVVSIAVIAGAFSSAKADDLDARIAALERENAALRKQLRIRELEKKNAALREQLSAAPRTKQHNPQIAMPATPRPAARRAAAKPDGLAAVARALTYAPLGDPPYAAKDPAPLDLYLPVARWAGWYFGGHGGMGFGNWPLTTTGNDRNVNFNPSSVTSFSSTAETTLNAVGALGGVQTGYLWQIGQFAFGPEIDISVGEIGEHDAQTLTTTQVTSSIGTSSSSSLAQAESSIRWLSTLRGRIGFSADDWMFFGTGGLAIGGVDIWDAISSAAKSRYTVGYVAGGGFQYAIGPQFAFRAEYLYYGFPETTVTTDFAGGSSVNSLTTNATARLTPASHVIRAGLDVRLY